MRGAKRLWQTLFEKTKMNEMSGVDGCVCGVASEALL